MQTTGIDIPQEKIDQFKKDGYFVVESVIPNEHVELLRLRGGKLAARGARLKLQDHGDPVWYRAIRMRTIPPGEKLVSENIRPQKISPEVRAAEQKKLKGILARRKAAARKKKKP